MEKKDVTTKTKEPEFEGLEAFAQRLLEDKQVTNLEPETLDIMRGQLVERLEKLTNRVTIEALSDDALNEFDKLTQANAGEEEIQEFINKKIPDINERLTKAYFEFRVMYLG